MPRSEGLDHDEGASTRFMVAPGGVLSEGYGYGGPGVGLGDGQMEADQNPHSILKGLTAMLLNPLVILVLVLPSITITHF